MLFCWLFSLAIFDIWIFSTGAFEEIFFSSVKVLASLAINDLFFFTSVISNIGKFVSNFNFWATASVIKTL